MAMPSAKRKRSYDGEYMNEGRKAELVVMAWLLLNSDVIDFDDCRPFRPAQGADYDFAVRNRDGTAPLVEVKSDRHLGSTGNMVFEIARVNHTAPAEKAVTLGWSARSPASRIIYYAPSVDRIYIVRTMDFRECFQRYSEEVRGGVRTEWISTDNIKSTIIALIPEKYWQGVVEIYDVVGLECQMRQHIRNLVSQETNVEEFTERVLRWAQQVQPDIKPSKNFLDSCRLEILVHICLEKRK